MDPMDPIDKNPWWMSDRKVNPLLRPVGAVRQLAGGAAGLRPFWRMIPTKAGCKQCHSPFLGPWSLCFRLIQLRPSRKNPNLCTV